MINAVLTRGENAFNTFFNAISSVMIRSDSDFFNHRDFFKSCHFIGISFIIGNDQEGRTRGLDSDKTNSPSAHGRACNADAMRSFRRTILCLLSDTKNFI